MFDVPAASLSPWEPERSGDSRRQRVGVRALPLDHELFESVFGDHKVDREALKSPTGVSLSGIVHQRRTGHVVVAILSYCSQQGRLLKWNMNYSRSLILNPVC